MGWTRGRKNFGRHRFLGLNNFPTFIQQGRTLSSPSRLDYYRRIFVVYLNPGASQLSFWHDAPEVNPNVAPGELGEYYMPFAAKADYSGPFDAAGVPLLNYRGKIGLQHNPIAIAQYGLGNHNQFRRSGDPERRRKFLLAADWLAANLEQNSVGLWVWNHHFDWEYRTSLRSPWQSGLAQGQGISLLVRAHRETSDSRYMQAAQQALRALQTTVSQGGVVFVDDHGHKWFEEYIVNPPTHILNGFIWASWGVYDYWLATGDARAHQDFLDAIETLTQHLCDYDTGFWSLYEQSGTRLKMLASPFYHRLHIAQLHVLHQLTGGQIFANYAQLWEGYQRNPVNRARALLYKTLFKLLYY
jgi:hypothetical protein